MFSGGAEQISGMKWVKLNMKMDFQGSAHYLKK